MTSRLRLKVCEARQRGRNLKMKSGLSPPWIEAGVVEFKDEV